MAVSDGARAVLSLTLVLCLLPSLVLSQCSPSTATCRVGVCSNATTCVCNASTMFTGSLCNEIMQMPTTGHTEAVPASASTWIQSLMLDIKYKGEDVGLPLGANEYAQKIYVCSNGYLTFDHDFCTARIDELLQTEYPVSYIAPFATSFDFRKSEVVSSVTKNNVDPKLKVKIVDDISADSYLKSLQGQLPDLQNCSSAIVVTWEKLTPPNFVSETTKRASFQLIIFTNWETQTWALTIYDTVTVTDYFDWIPTLIRCQTKTANKTIADKRSSAVSKATTSVNIANVKGKVVLENLFNLNTNINRVKRCLDLKTSVSAAWTVSSTLRNWCPTSLKQATVDPRFMTGGNSTYSLQYNLANLTDIMCKYDLTSGAFVPVLSSTLITGQPQTQYMDYCCKTSTALCASYMSTFPMPMSSAYKKPNSLAYLVGNGHFKTFDSYQYNFMDHGDYVLVQNTNMFVVARLSDSNSNNKSVAATAVYVNIKNITVGTPQLELELYWNKTTKSIDSASLRVGKAATSFGITRGNGNYIRISESSALVFVQETSAWVEISTYESGLNVVVFDEKVTASKGLFGNADGNVTNDIRNSASVVTVSPTQGEIQTVMATWKKLDSEFNFTVSMSAVSSAFTPTFWNSTLMDTWLGNSSTAAKTLCNVTYMYNDTLSDYQNCLMEYFYCGQAVCSANYYNFTRAVDKTFKELSVCSSGIIWKTSALTWDVSIGSVFTKNLTADFFDAGVIKSTFVYGKVAGPSNLTISGDQLIWTPSASDYQLIILSVYDNATSDKCPSTTTISVKVKKASSPCGTGGTEVAQTSTNMLYDSMCTCNANYYGSTCSYQTCPFHCYFCDPTSKATCLACPNHQYKTLPSNTYHCDYVDECLDTSRCNKALAAYDQCRSLLPASKMGTNDYQCTCAKGYHYKTTGSVTSKIECEDVNECSSPIENTCQVSRNETCANTPGSFKCDCASGYVSNNVSCVDVNECAATTNPCTNGDCVNTVGGFTCNCKSGYTKASGTNCVDVNECANPKTNLCQQTCTNINGNYTCACETGYTLTNTYNCVAATACTNTTLCNSATSLCSKISGTDTCSCKAGYVANGTNICSPKTYCTAGACGSGGNCVETPPGYACTCADHHVLNTVTKLCEKKDYCGDSALMATVCPSGTGLSTCSVNSTTNAPTCVCKTGYTAISNVCTDINECSNSSLNSCHQFSTSCRNTVGDYTCDCLAGYKRVNNTNCEAASISYTIVTKFNLTFTPALLDTKSKEYADMVTYLEGRLTKYLTLDGSSHPGVKIVTLRSGSVEATAIASYSTPPPGGAAGLSTSITSACSDCSGTTVAATNECTAVPKVNKCDSSHRCEKVTTAAGGYNCLCLSGYTQTGYVNGYPDNIKIQSCADINECLTTCNETNKICVNQPGNYSCTCTKGMFAANPKTEACQKSCTPDRCKNGGQCQDQDTDSFPYKCICMAGYTGLNCELVDDHYTKMRNTAIAVGVVLGILLLLAIIVLVFFYLRKRQTKGKYTGTQNMNLMESSIPRAKPGGSHPSQSNTYENRAYDTDQPRQKTDYF